MNIATTGNDLREEQDMRKHLLTLLASAALAFGIAGQASARDYHGGHDRHYERHYDRGHHHHGHYNNQWRHGRYYGHNHYYRPYRPYYSGYYYAPPPAPYYGGYGYGVGYSQPGFGIYIGR
jgi:hypothetical protein